MGLSIDLAGKTALVTGANTGIGAAIAVSLAQAGADVALHTRDGEAAEILAILQALGRKGEVFQAELASRSAQVSLVDEVMDRFGRIDILVNNAGLIRRAPAEEYSEEDWDLVLEVNLSAVFRLCQLVGKHMLAQGSGKIVNIASLLSFQGGVLVPAYAASKGAVAQLTKALANEWAGRGINVNAIAPGYITTANTQALREDAERSRQILARIPAGRWGRPEDIGGAAAFLCSELAEYLHGHVLAVDGGWLAR